MQELVYTQSEENSQKIVIHLSMSSSGAVCRVAHPSRTLRRVGTTTARSTHHAAIGRTGGTFFRPTLAFAARQKS